MPTSIPRSIRNAAHYDGTLQPYSAKNFRKCILAFSLILLSSLTVCSQDLQRGIVACYPFKGNANDLSGNNNNGTVNGATLTTDRNGNANSAYYFNGQGNYIEVPADQLRNSQYSFSFWAFMSGFPTVGSVFHALSVGSYGGDQNISMNNIYTIYPSPPSLGWTGGSYAASGTTAGYSTGVLPALDRWYHLVLTRSNSTVSLYIDGQLAGNAATGGPRPITAKGQCEHILARDPPYLTSFTEPLMTSPFTTVQLRM